VNTPVTHQDTTSPATTPSAVTRQPRLAVPEAEQLLLYQHTLGVPLGILAAVTRPSLSELTQVVDATGSTGRPHHSPTVSDDTLWHTDLAILAGAIHSTRTTVTLGATAEPRRRRGAGEPGVRRRGHAGQPRFTARLRTLAITEYSRLIAHIDTLSPPERALAVLRLVVVAAPHTDTALLAALTDAAHRALTHTTPATGAGLLGWLATLHAAHGYHDQALDFSTRQLRLLACPPPTGQKIDASAELHARWCQAALLDLAGRHVEALRLHTDLPRVLGQVAAAVLSEDEDRDEFDLIDARNHAAAGTQALHLDLLDEAADHLAEAAGGYRELLWNAPWHQFDKDMLGYELGLVRFALGYARHRRRPGTGGSEWLACVLGLTDLHALGHLQHQRAAHVVERARAALNGQVDAVPDRPAPLPLPRLPMAGVSAVLLEDGVLWEMPLAPNAGAPDLPHLH